MLTSICVNTYNRPDFLTKTLQGIAQYAKGPYELVIVDDCSPNPDVRTIISMFQKEFEKTGVSVTIHFSEKNLGAAGSTNKAMSLAKGEVIIHIEDDIVVPYEGWNLKFAEMLNQYPELGQVVPTGSGRSDFIPREEYTEFGWALGGLFAIRREVYEKVGGWDVSLRHQIEPDYNLRVRMAGWRIAEVPEIKMVHMGDGDQDSTFRKQAMIVCGVHQMLMKWNKRFTGMWDYDSLWAMTWDDFPPNMNFRRQVVAWFVAQAERLLKEPVFTKNTGVIFPSATKQLLEEMTRCRLNSAPEKFKVPGQGEYELIRTIRAKNREREQELIDLMRANHVFGSVNRLSRMLQDLAKQMNYPLSEEELGKLLKSVPDDYDWTHAEYRKV